MDKHFQLKEDIRLKNSELYYLLSLELNSNKINLINMKRYDGYNKEILSISIKKIAVINLERDKSYNLNNCTVEFKSQYGFYKIFASDLFSGKIKIYYPHLETIEIKITDDIGGCVDIRAILLYIIE